jgi:hypothetical protein
VVALEALTKYAIMLPHSENGLSVVVTATEMEHTFYIHEHERLLLKRQPLPVLPTEVEVDAVGEGCALIQVGYVHMQFLLDDDILFTGLICHHNWICSEQSDKISFPLISFLLHTNCNFLHCFCSHKKQLFFILSHFNLDSQIPSPT